MDLVEVNVFNVFGWSCWVEFSGFAPQIDGSACSVPWIEARPHDESEDVGSVH